MAISSVSRCGPHFPINTFCTETMFYATSADVVPFEYFGPKAEEMRGRLKLANDNNVRTGMIGKVFAVL